MRCSVRYFVSNKNELESYLASGSSLSDSSNVGIRTLKVDERHS
jgi:hypothetical protein